MFTRILVAGVLAGSLVACASGSKKLNQVSLGMNKAQVISAMGAPDTTAAKDGREFMIYKLGSGTDAGTAATCASMGVLTLGMMYINPECRGGHKNDYFVLLEGGEVTSYGRVGDFDSTKEADVVIDVQ